MLPLDITTLNIPQGLLDLTLVVVDCCGVVASYQDSRGGSEFDSRPIGCCIMMITRGRHSANHNLLPDMHLRVPVVRVKTCHDSRLVQDVGGFGKL